MWLSVHASVWASPWCVVLRCVILVLQPFLSYYGVEARTRINQHFNGESALNQLEENRSVRRFKLICWSLVAWVNSIQLSSVTVSAWGGAVKRSSAEKSCLYTSQQTSVTCALPSSSKQKVKHADGIPASATAAVPQYEGIKTRDNSTGAHIARPDSSLRF